MPHPRVLVVEDDPTVSRFIETALQGLEVQVVLRDSVRAAQAALAERAFSLVLTDLTFRDESGLDLVRGLQALGAAAPRVLVFSGGLHQSVRDQLAALGVYRSLPKPASASELARVVGEALDMADWPQAPEHPSATAHNGLQAFELAAIETYFDGDRAFYDTFRASCVQQFPLDLREGDAACAAADPVALRRVAHSLKSVLQTLGYADHSVCAKALEQTAQQRPWSEALAGWQDLRQRLVQSFGLAV